MTDRAASGSVAGVDHTAVLEHVVRWAEVEGNVRAVLLEGSLARDDGSVDELSDLDVRLYVTDPNPLLTSSDWFEQFGRVLVVEALENPGWHPTRLVYLVDGKIDFLIMPASSLANRQRFGRRVRVLLDKDDLTASIAQGNAPAASLPTESTYLTCVNEFYAAALMYARMLVRDEPIKAKYRDWDMKTRLFAMVEWDHLARYDDQRGVRPRGSRFRDWVDRDTMAELDRCCSRGIGPSRDALDSTVAMFTAVSPRVARAVGIAPFDAARVTREIQRIADLRA